MQQNLIICYIYLFSDIHYTWACVFHTEYILENVTGPRALCRSSSEVCSDHGANALSAVIIVWGAIEADSRVGV